MSKQLNDNHDNIWEALRLQGEKGWAVHTGPSITASSFLSPIYNISGKPCCESWMEGEKPWSESSKKQIWVLLSSYFLWPPKFSSIFTFLGMNRTTHRSNHTKEQHCSNWITLQATAGLVSRSQAANSGTFHRQKFGLANHMWWDLRSLQSSLIPVIDIWVWINTY